MEVVSPSPTYVLVKEYVVLVESTTTGLQNAINSRLNLDDPDNVWELIGGISVVMSPSYTREYHQAMVVSRNVTPVLSSDPEV